MEVFGNEKCLLGKGDKIFIEHDTRICVPGLDPIRKRTTTEVVVLSIVDKDGNMVIGGGMKYSVVVRGSE